MRKRTDGEKAAMGRIVPILEGLDIKKNTRGYMPLLDLMSYAAAYPNVKLKDIIDELSNNNTYIGISITEDKKDNQVFPAMVRTIESAFERGRDTQLKELGISKEVIDKVLDSKGDKEDQLELLEVLGEEYKSYSHEERIVFYFVKKILKYLGY